MCGAGYFGFVVLLIDVQSMDCTCVFSGFESGRIRYARLDLDWQFMIFYFQQPLCGGVQGRKVF